MNIVIFVNKDFEYNGYIEGIDSRDYCTILDRVFEDTEARPNKMTPSRIYKFGDNAIRATEYCISYMFSDLKYTSSSEQKYKLLYELLSEKIDCIPDYVISVSTSESTPESQGGDSDTNSINGCVLLGNQFYARDCRDIDPGSGSSPLPDAPGGGHAIHSKHLTIHNRRYQSDRENEICKHHRTPERNRPDREYVSVPV